MRKLLWFWLLLSGWALARELGRHTTRVDRLILVPGYLVTADRDNNGGCRFIDRSRVLGLKYCAFRNLLAPPFAVLPLWTPDGLF